MGKKYLFINTVNPSLPSFVLFGNKQNAQTAGFIDKQENLNAELKLFFKKNKCQPEDLAGVMVITGPGSFSASRAGIVFANSFNFLYKIPVMGVKDEPEQKIENLTKKYLPKLAKAKKTSVASVFYKTKPHITMPKAG